jgi:death-on-curing protein
MTDSFWYQSVEDVLDIHEDIVSAYPDTSSSVQSRGDIEFALQYVSEGRFGSVPKTIHGKAFHLLRLRVANHPFVDGNKRTALDTTTVFYLLNGRRFEYDNESREILAKFGTDEKAVDEDYVLGYLRTHTTEVDLNEVVERWRGDLVEYGVARLIDESSDPNDYLDSWSRDKHGEGRDDKRTNVTRRCDGGHSSRDRVARPQDRSGRTSRDLRRPRKRVAVLRPSVLDTRKRELRFRRAFE